MAKHAMHWTQRLSDIVEWTRLRGDLNGVSKQARKNIDLCSTSG